MQIISLIVIIAVPIAFIYFTFIKNKVSYFRKHGIAATAKVISIEKTGFNKGGGAFSVPVMELVLEVQYAGDETDTVTKRMTFENGEITPKAGDIVNILIDPKNSNNILVLPDKN